MAATTSFDDPVGDTPEFAPDLGVTTVTISDEETISVDTRLTPRPPAGWGGCAYYVGIHAEWVVKPEVVVECSQ